MYIIKFKKAIGEIPKDALGFFHEDERIEGGLNYTRVWVPRQYTGLSKDLMACYLMPTNDKNQFTLQSEDWERVQDITDIERQQLLDLESEIKEKQIFYMGPDGITATAMGNINLIKKIFE
jgi:hypothetical protein